MIINNFVVFVKHVLLLCGLVITSQAIMFEESYPSDIFEVAKPKTEAKPAEPNINVKNLNEDQQRLFFGISPKMVERTKVLNKVRKLKDQGEEKTKVIYRTRVIGLFNPKMISNLNSIDNLLNALSNPEDEDEFHSDSGENSKFCKVNNKETNNINSEFGKATNTEMPKNQHSSKKELRDNVITVKSAETLTPHENTLEEKNFPLHRTVSFADLSKLKPATPPSPTAKFNHHSDKDHDVETHLKQPANLFDKANFLNTVEDENETGFAPIPNPLKNTKFVDSLELYRQKQKKEQALNDLRTYVNTHLFHTNNSPTLKPILQRQYSIYRYPHNNLNNNNNEHVMNNNVKNDVTNKPIFKQPSDTIVYFPAGNHANMDNRIQEQNKINSPINKINPAQTRPTTPDLNSLRQDWLNDLLSRKVAQAEAAHLAQLKTAQGQGNDMHKKEQQILHQEQRIAA